MQEVKNVLHRAELLRNIDGVNMLSNLGIYHFYYTICNTHSNNNISLLNKNLKNNHTKILYI